MNLHLALLLSFLISPSTPNIPSPHDLPQVRNICQVRDKVPICVVLGTFPDNPAWIETLQRLTSPPRPNDPNWTPKLKQRRLGYEQNLHRFVVPTHK